MMMLLRHGHEMRHQTPFLPNLRTLMQQSMHLVTNVLGPRTQASAYLSRQHAFGRQANREADAQLNRTMLQSPMPLEPIDKRSSRVFFTKLAVPDRTRSIFASYIRILYRNIGFVRRHLQRCV